MAFQERKAPIRLSLNKELFNRLLAILDSNYKLNIKENDFSDKAEKLLKKILKYTTFEKDNNIAVVGFFPFESSNLIMQLLISAGKKENIYDYFNEVLKYKK